MKVTHISTPLRPNSSWIKKYFTENKMKTRILYHANCFDGMASAWAAWRKFGDSAEYKPVTYGPKDINEMMQDCYENANINDDLYILDFSFPREVLEALHNKVNKLVVLDHHKTAEADLKGLDYCKFDMHKSGARLAWEYFYYPHHGQQGTHLGFDSSEHQNQAMGLNPFYIPKLVQYVEDRDLWRFELTNSHEINAFIQSYPMTLHDYELVARYLEDSFDRCLQQGHGIERYKQTMVDAQCKASYMSIVGGYDNIPTVNSTILFSEVGNELCKRFPEAPFAAYFTVKQGGTWQWGLRSIGDFDVSEVAKLYGGGGHRNAAGFIK